jgi:hypothetical protein
VVVGLPLLAVYKVARADLRELQLRVVIVGLPPRLKRLLGKKYLDSSGFLVLLTKEALQQRGPTTTP